MGKFYTNIKRVGNTVYHRGYDENGKRVSEAIQYSPTLYISSGKEETRYKSLDGVNLKPITFDTMKTAKEFIDSYGEVDNAVIYGNRKYNVQYTHDHYKGIIDYDISKIHICFFDIEVEDLTDEYPGFPDPTEANHSVVTISVVDENNKKTIFAICDYEPEPDENFIKCSDEMSLLNEWICFLEKEDFDVLSGWNIGAFDIPYLYHRITKLFDEPTATRMSPWRFTSKKIIKEQFGHDVIKYELFGIEILDYIDVFKKFNMVKQENYKLDTIASIFLGKRKLDYSEYGKLRTLYKQNPQKHTAYCMRDTILVKELDNTLEYFRIVYELAYMAKVNLSETLGTTALWDSYIYGDLMSRNIIVPPEVKRDRESFEGAFVKDVDPRLNGWMMTFDATSLYPSIIMQCNISPETIGGFIPQVTPDRLLRESVNVPDGFCLTAAGRLFNKEKSAIIPKLVSGLFNKRKSVKKEMLNKKQLVEKLKHEKQLRGL